MKYLIINADDFGYSRERNDGILQCHKQKTITSTSLLVNGTAVKEAAQIAHTYDIPTGLHLNLTEGNPIGQTGYDTLVGDGGCFLGKHGFRQALKDKKINIDEVRREIQCQVNRFRELMNYTPGHTDGHQHIHVLPEICEVFASVLKDNNILVTRVPSEILNSVHPWRSTEQKEFKSNVVYQAKMARPVFTQAGIWTTDSFLGLQTMGSDMTVERLIQQLNQVFKIDQSASSETNIQNCSKTCELMAHPGYMTGKVGGCGDGPDGFSQSIEREHEMSVLADKDLLMYYQNAGIKLASFQQCVQQCSKFK